MEKKKLYLIKCGIFLMIFILNGLTVFSQTYAIKGVVVSDDRVPIEFANVVLSDIEGKILKGTITDSLGRFNLVLDDNLKQTGKIMTVSYLGYKSYVQPVKTDDVGIIILLPDNNKLNEVVVTARRSPYTMKGTTLAVNVQNSILKTSGNAGDVLKQLPLISIKDGNVSVFGKGKTLVYIDNRELRSIEELQKLSSGNIKKIDIVTVPGAQYSASTGAVVRIYTVEPAKGISGLVHAKVQRGADWSESLLTSIAYAENRFALFADYAVHDIRRKESQHTDVTINGKSNGVIRTDSQLYLKRRTHDLSFATEYKISEQHLWGVKYNHSFLDAGHYKVKGEIAAYSNSKTDAKYNQLSDYYPKGNNGNINLFYKGKIFEWNIDVNADYSFGDNRTSAVYDNKELVGNVRKTVSSGSKNNYNLYAAKLELSRQIGDFLLLLGGDYAGTRNRSFYSNDGADLQDDLPKTATTNNQDLCAMFFNGRYKAGIYNFEMGLRYEYVNQRYRVNGKKIDNQSRKYSNLFPSLSISRLFFNERVNVSLSYRRVVNRPSYYQLRGDVQYNSPYSYEAGNPLLRNTYVDDISCMVSYSDLNFMASYKSYHDKTLFTIEQYEDKPITISRFTNADRFKKISIAAIWDPTFFKIWNPEVEVGLERQFFKFSVGNEIKSYNRPCIYVGLFNVLKFHRDWSFVVQAKYRTSGNSGVSYENSTMYVDAYIQKSFFDRTMSVKVGAENIFNTYNDSWKMTYKNINYMKSVNNDNRFAYISFTYNLHKAKKYTGKGTRNSERKRLTAL